MRIARRPSGACADHSQRAASTRTASCASSTGLSSGSHGSGAAPAGTSNRPAQLTPSTANKVHCSGVRIGSKRSPSGTVSQRQRNSATAVTSSHGSSIRARPHPCASAKRSASHRQASDTTDGHSNHHRNCAASDVRSSPARRHHRLRTPSSANTAQASAPYPANGWSCTSACHSANGNAASTIASVVSTCARAGQRRCISAASQPVTAAAISSASGSLRCATKRRISWLTLPSHHSRPHR
ncbi:hypothetical protein D3C71_1152960 [compost metagenome]